MSMERILNRRKQPQIPFRKEIPAAEGPLHGLNSGICKRRVAAILIKYIMEAASEVARQLIDPIEKSRVGRLAAGKNQRNTSLVDQNRVDLVDNRRGKWTMNLILRIKSNLIAQVIEADLVCHGVGDIAEIRLLALFAAHALLYAAHREAEELIDRAHPIGIPPGQIVVHGHYMDALARLRIPDNCRNRGQRLSFAGLHLCDLSIAKCKRALKLNVEHIQSQQSFRGHSGEGDGFRQCLSVFPCSFQLIAELPAQLAAARIDRANDLSTASG